MHVYDDDATSLPHQEQTTLDSNLVGKTANYCEHPHQQENQLARAVCLLAIFCTLAGVCGVCVMFCSWVTALVLIMCEIGVMVLWNAKLKSAHTNKIILFPFLSLFTVSILIILITNVIDWRTMSVLISCFCVGEYSHAYTLTNTFSIINATDIWWVQG